MDRRRFLGFCCAVVPAIDAGCSTQPGTETIAQSSTDETDSGTPPPATDENQSSPTGTADSPLDAAVPVEIVVHNGRSSSLDAGLTVAREDDVVFDETITVEADSFQTVDPNITEQDQYELTVSLSDGSEESFPFSLEAYDLREGSNLIVEVGTEIRIMMEE